MTMTSNVVSVVPQDNPGASKAMVLGKLAQQEAHVVQEDSVSIEFTCESGSFFIPQPPDGLYYTIPQLKMIELALACFELELLPLDPYLSIN